MGLRPYMAATRLPQTESLMKTRLAHSSARGLERDGAHPVHGPAGRLGPGRVRLVAEGPDGSRTAREVDVGPGEVAALALTLEP
jgi:hypothetical protein